jgi:AcrR family transcriptional regulator
MRLFAEIGYAEATNPRIAEAAGLTRGAMLYHFDSRESLVEAAADYIQTARAALLAEAAADLQTGADVSDRAIDTYWRLLQEPAFRAFSELEAAARMDAAVAERIRPAQEAFDRGAMGESLLTFIQAGVDPRFQTSRDLARFALEGLARARLSYDEPERVRRLLAVVKRAVHMLNRKGVVQDLWVD